MEDIKNNNQSTNQNLSTLTDKEWLDLSWKYFQQHAQQRVSYFNFFVVFSTILTTGYISTFQESFIFPAIGLGLSFVQLFVAFIFTKLDARNSYLVKHAEESIKKIEEVNPLINGFPLFTIEETKSNKIKAERAGDLFLLQPFTHGKSFRWIYTFFMLVGLAELVLSSVFLFIDLD